MEELFMKTLAESISKILSFENLKKYKAMLIDTTGKVLERFTMNNIPKTVHKEYGKRVFSTDIIDMQKLINIQIINEGK